MSKCNIYCYIFDLILLRSNSNNTYFFSLSCGPWEDRTPDLVIANDALYQLSQRPFWKPPSKNKKNRPSQVGSVKKYFCVFTLSHGSPVACCKFFKNIFH